MFTVKEKIQIIEWYFGGQSIAETITSFILALGDKPITSRSALQLCAEIASMPYLLRDMRLSLYNIFGYYLAQQGGLFDHLIRICRS